MLLDHPGPAMPWKIPFIMADRDDAQPRATFEQILETTDLPSPGPEYYEARRRLWLTPRVAPAPAPPSSAREKLEEILGRPNSLQSNEVWNNGLERVWKGLSSGGKLKNRLPMNLIIKIIYAAWLRDQTWPAGMQPADSDEELQQDVPTSEAVETPPEQSTPIPTIAASEVLEAPSPWMLSGNWRR